MYKKLFYLILVSIIFIIFIIFYNQNIKRLVYQLAPEKVKTIYQIVFKDKKFYTIIAGNKIDNKIKEYRVRFLPETQLMKVDFYTKHLNLPNNFNKENKKNLPALKEFNKDYQDLTKKNNRIEYHYKYFLEKHDSKIIFVNDKGVISEILAKKILNNNDNLKPKIIESNLPNIIVLDTLVYEDTLFISGIDKNSDCMNENLDNNSNVNTKKLFGNYTILSAKINSSFYDFKNFFNSSECGKNIMGGRMKPFEFKENRGILFTTSDIYRIDGTPNNKSQRLDSIYGKTIFINFSDNNLTVYSMGHRNAQGLFVENDLVLQTEHGPRGGDEINKITFKNNYGWPEATYGTIYPYDKLKKPKYKKNHSLNGYEEPIFSYVPSIGISEIIKISNSFHPGFWQNNFLISSLGARSLFRVKFDENYTKILFNEKILIGERIRDLIFLKELNLILLSLENSKLGILKNLN